MSKIKSLEELKSLRNKLKENIQVREEGDNKVKVIIGMATCGIAAGARETMNAMVDEASILGIQNVIVIQSGCMGSCYAEPTVEIREIGKEPILYGNVSPDLGREIVRKHIKDGELVQNLIIGKPFETV